MKPLNYKRLLMLASLAVFAIASASCGRNKQIPEDTLADIFRDMYILNAYIERNNMNLKLDSVDVYAPLLESYGYTPGDFTNTITDAAKRKSFRITDIVEAAISKLEQEQSAIDEKVRIMNFIDSTAIAVSSREIFRDSLITIRGIADSAAMTLRVPLDEGDGKVIITYYYTLDSLDGNKDLTNRHVLINGEGEERSSSILRMFHGNRREHNTSLSGYKDVEELEITFGNYPQKPKRMHLTIDSLIVVRQPPLKKAYEILSREYTYRLMIDGKEYYEYYNPKTDRRALRVPSPLLDPQRDSLVVE